MREIILPALRSHVPGVPENASKPTWHLPIHIYTESGVDLDFGTLLLFDNAVIDSYTVDYLNDNDRPELEPLKHSISVLLDADYIRVEDLGQEIENVRPVISQQVEKTLEDPLPLRAPLLKGIAEYQARLPKIISRHAESDDNVLELGFGQHIYMMKNYGRIEEKELRRIERLLRRRRGKWTDDELELLRQIIRPTVTYLYQNLAVGQVFGTPFLDVDYTTHFYEFLLRDSILGIESRGSNRKSVIDAGRKLFDIAIPDLRPAGPDQMLRLLRNTSIQQFRDYVDQLAHDEKPVDGSEFSKLLAEVLRAGKELEAIKGRVTWSERFVAMVPLPGIGVATGLAGMLAERHMKKKKLAKYEWVYALVNSASD